MPNSDAEIKSVASRLRSTIPYLLAASSFTCAAVVGYELMTKDEGSLTAYVAGLVAAATGVATAIYQRFRELESDKQNAELVRLQRENQELVAGLKQNLTGGDSFAAIYFPLVDGRRMMTIRHFGAEPLTNIRVAVIKFAPMQHIDGLIYPTLPSNAVETVKPVNLQFEKRFPLQIDFKTLNSSWSETLICAKAGEEIVFALRVWKFGANDRGSLTQVTLHEEVHPRFPRDANGAVDWTVDTVDMTGAQPVLESPEQAMSRRLGMA